MTTCCENPRLFDNEGQEICGNCNSLIADNIAVEAEWPSATSRVRLNKFNDLIYKKNLPPHLRNPLIKMFPHFENFFFNNEEIKRDNFINLEHLINEILTRMGEPTYASLFKRLKTKDRVKFINNIVDIYLRTGTGYGVPYNQIPIRSIPPPKGGDWECKIRNGLNDHVYSG